MRFILMSLILLVGIFSHAQDEHKRAYEFYKRGNYKDALVLLEEAIQSHPDWYFPILLKGQCNQKLKRYEEALRNFNDALTLEVPSADIPRVKNYMAKCYMAMKDYKKAAQAFTELLSLAPASRKFDLLFSRGQCEMQLAKADEESRKTSSAKSWYSKAVVSFSEAIKADTQRNDLKIEASFQKAFSQYKIGNITGGIKSLEDSIKAFQDVITRNPKEKRAHKFIINLQLQIVESTKGDAKVREYSEMVGYIDRYLKTWPKDDEMLNKKGLALQGAKNYKDAVNVFDLVLRNNPKDGEVWFSMGSCQMADGQYKKAISSLNKAAGNGLKTDPRIYTYIANCYAKQKTKCYGTDIKMEKNAIAALEKGVGATSGRAKAALQKELGLKKKNLTILQDNLSTDNSNHLATMENIRNLTAGIGKNTSILSSNQEKYLAQPTEELQKAIKATQETLAADKADLAKEWANLEKLIKEAKKCSGDLVHYKDMVALLNNKK